MTGGFETLIRSKRARLALATTLAATALWSFAPYVANEVGSQAFVNAPLERLTAPIAGTVGALPDTGTYLAAATPLRLVSARGDDTGRVGEIAEVREVAAATLALADRQLTQLAAERARLDIRIRAYDGASRRRSAAQLGVARFDVAACAAGLAEAAAMRDRVSALATRGFASRATLDRAEAAVAGIAATCGARTATVAVRDAERRAALDGVFIGDGASDTPYAVQQRDRLLLRAQEIASVRVAAAVRLAELDLRLADARAAQARAARFDAALPGGSVVWARRASPGAAVAPGAALLDLADCTRRFVAVTLPERRIESLAAGEAARVRLIGSDTWTTGRVTRVAGAAVHRDTALDAAGETDRDARALSVEIALTAPPGVAARVRRCDIGRLAEVRFDRHWL